MKHLPDRLQGPYSLRARLLAGVLSLSAAILILVTVALYAQQKRSEYDRIDGQARAAVFAVNRALNGNGVSGGEDRSPAAVLPRPPRGLPSGAGDGRPAAALPPNVYGVRIDASGKKLGSVLVGYSDAAPSPPKLPSSLPLDRPFTVNSVSESGSYRVVAQAAPGGTVTAAAVPLSGVTDQLRRLMLTEALLLGGGLLFMGLFGAWVIGVALTPLDAMGRTAGAIAAGDLSHRVSPDDDRTEVGRLGAALNAMLAQIERAFTRQRASEDQLRRFLADASHELRTPLSSIRGYAELHRMGASPEPDAVAHAMKRIEAESTRMGVLVEDLLTLARQDEQREPVREPVSMTRIAEDAVSDAHVTDGNGRAITLEVLPPGAPATVTGDPDGLRQVLGNLLRNALVHTPPGSPVEVAVDSDSAAGSVTVTVRDHGPGLPVDEPNLLFDRFWRAAPGRERGPAGAGLGLAIVAAVIDTHGGSVSAAQAEGGGAVFTVVLPGAR